MWLHPLIWDLPLVGVLSLFLELTPTKTALPNNFICWDNTVSLKSPPTCNSRNLSMKLIIAQILKYLVSFAITVNFIRSTISNYIVIIDVDSIRRCFLQTFAQVQIKVFHNWKFLFSNTIFLLFKSSKNYPESFGYLKILDNKKLLQLYEMFEILNNDEKVKCKVQIPPSLRSGSSSSTSFRLSVVGVRVKSFIFTQTFAFIISATGRLQKLFN